MAAAGEHEALARALIEEHYDPRYARGTMRRDAAPGATVRLDGPAGGDVERAAQDVLAAMG